MGNRWKVKPIGFNHSHYPHYWGVYNGPYLYDSAPTLVEAHTCATQQAVADVLFSPGGLTRLVAMKRIVDICSDYLIANVYSDTHSAMLSLRS